jgi:hypothetical protein
MTVLRRVQFGLGSACHGFSGPVSQRGPALADTGPPASRRPNGT